MDPRNPNQLKDPVVERVSLACTMISTSVGEIQKTLRAFLHKAEAYNGLAATVRDYLAGKVDRESLGRALEHLDKE